MRRRASWWVLSVVLATMTGVVSGAGSAAAEVTVTPTRATQGDPARLTFRVTDDRPGAYTTTIQLLLPESAPVAETWPMSVPDWAPKITMRTLDQPLPGLHHGRVTEVVTAITWLRADSAGDDPTPAELSISLGPMPQADRMVFTVVQTYSDGFVVTWDGQPAAGGAQPERPAAIVTLVPPTARQPEPGTESGDPATVGPGSAGGVSDGTDSGGGFGPMDLGLAAVLLAGVALAGWLLFRGRRGVPDLPSSAATGPTSGVDDPPSGLAGPTAGGNDPMSDESGTTPDAAPAAESTATDHPIEATVAEPTAPVAPR